MSAKSTHKTIPLLVAVMVLCAVTIWLWTSARRSLPPPSRPPELPFPTATGSTGYLAVKGGIYKDNQRLVLHGINWFGAEGNRLVPQGLDKRNLHDMVTQMKRLGFNAVRLPLCPATIRGKKVTLDKIVDEFNSQQMYILLDHHTYDCNKIGEKLPEVWYSGTDRFHADYTETMWIEDLTTLASRYKDRQYFLGIDLKNEPHKNVNGSYGAEWGTGNLDNDWNKAAERAGKAILAVNPDILIFIEGISNYEPGDALPACNLPAGESVAWGENLAYVKCAPIDQHAIPPDKAVFSPHMYLHDTTSPADLPAAWERHFGYLMDLGYTVVPGEWGAQIGPWQQTLMNYLEEKHLCSSFYWSWNPNADATGGLLQNDWWTPWPEKLKMLQEYFGKCK